MIYSHRLAVRLVLAVLAFWLVLERPAHAYLDPGTGSYLFQLLVGAVFSALFGIRLFWTNIKLFFASLLSRKKSDSDDSHDAR